MFDLNIYPIHVKKSVEQLEMPGLMAASAPARCARNRQGDQIVVLTTFEGPVPFSAMSIEKQLNDLTSTYFQSQGPVTSGVRAAIEQYNSVLLDYNLNAPSAGKHILGLVNLAVIHHQDLYLAHCGPTFSYHLAQEINIYTDSESSSHGLGLSRTVSIRFFHLEVAPGDYLLLTAHPPVSWTASNLANAGKITLDALRRRLFAQTPPDLRAVLVSLMDGSGMVNTQPALSSHSPIETASGFGLVREPVAPTLVLSSAIQSAVGAPSKKSAENPASQSGVFPWSTVDQILHSKRAQTAIEASSTAELQEEKASRPMPARQVEAQSAAAGQLRPVETEVDTITLPRAAFVRTGYSSPSTSTSTHSVPSQPRTAPPISPRMQFASASAGTAAIPSPGEPALRRDPGASSPEPACPEEPVIRRTRSHRTDPRSVDELFSQVRNKLNGFYQQTVAEVDHLFSPLHPQEESCPAGIAGENSADENPALSPAQWFHSLSAATADARTRVTSTCQSAQAGFQTHNPFKSISVPTSALVFIAILIPLVVVAAASTIYFQKGKSEQYKFYLEQAQTAAGAAAQLTDESEARKAWDTAIFMAQKAETYQATGESHALIIQAQSVIDQMDHISRVDFSNAIIGGLPGGVKITRMEASQTDLFLLDANNGKVLRAVMTGHGYELDNAFQCAPGAFGSYIVSPFIDFRLLPKGNSVNADVAAIDKGGNMVYCGADITTTSISLVPPDNNWGAIKAMDYDSGSLYVLDPVNNAVWVYSGGVTSDGNKPELFFGSKVPALGDAIDLAVNGNDLYLLHADGHLTQCSKNKVTGESATCTDPTAYRIVDNKNANNPVILPNTSFQQLAFVDPPDPALVILDAKGQMIYNFSVKMALHSKVGIRNASELRIRANQIPTGFTVNSYRQIFIAFDNQVYTGQIN